MTNLNVDSDQLHNKWEVIMMKFLIYVLGGFLFFQFRVFSLFEFCYTHFWARPGKSVGFEVKTLCWIDLLYSCREHFDRGGWVWEKTRSSREGVPTDLSHQLSYPSQEFSGRRLEDHLSESEAPHPLWGGLKNVVRMHELQYVYWIWQFTAAHK